MNKYTNRQAVTDLLEVIRNIGKLLNNHEDRLKRVEYMKDSLEERLSYLERRQSVEDDGR